MIQLTDKLFAIPIPENTIEIEFKKRGVYFKSANDKDNTLARLTMFNFDAILLGTVSKDTIDFDVEPFIEETDNPYHFSRGFKWIDYSNDINCFRTEEKEAAFRSLLTSKGCNPDEKHLIIEKI